MAVLAGLAQSAPAAEIKLLTTGAMKEVVLSVIPEFEKRTGHKVTVDNATAGVLSRRIREGEAFDVTVNTPAMIDDLIRAGKIAAGSRFDLARVGVGVAVKQGAPLPDISTVDAFKRTLIAARAVAHGDPTGLGSSGIYVAAMLARIGVADTIKGKTILVPGGLVAERVATGQAEIGLHQISEILAVKGVTLVGPLPAEIQNYTTYAVGLGAAAKDADAAKALIAALAAPNVEAVLKGRGMERAP
ncbi:MAG TPA: substrate-binding domain-containing protein [Xanthobacteraceae bacterium]|jgi:molybdate transport system substrate-binding protein